MSKLTNPKMRDGLPVVLQNRETLEDGSQYVESWDRLGDTVTVTVLSDDGSIFKVLKFTQKQYIALVNALKASY